MRTGVFTSDESGFDNKVQVPKEPCRCRDSCLRRRSTIDLRTNYSNIIQSLHPIRTDNAPAVGSTPGLVPAAKASPLKIHPKVFNMIDCWISDSESPVVTEINLDAVERNANQFNGDGLKQDGDWLSYAKSDSGGFAWSSRRASTTKSSIRKTAAARSQHRPLLSSTLNNGTFAETANRRRFAWFGCRLTTRNKRNLQRGRP